MRVQRTDKGKTALGVSQNYVKGYLNRALWDKFEAWRTGAGLSQSAGVVVAVREFLASRTENGSAAQEGR